MKAPIPGLGNMYVSVIFRPPNKPVNDFTQFITGDIEYTNRFHTVSESVSKSDIMNKSNVTRNYIIPFQRYSFVNEINLPTYISLSNGSAISSIDLVWHNLNFPRSSYVVSPAQSGHYTVSANFKVKHDSPPKTTRFLKF